MGKSNKEIIIESFRDVKALGWVKSRRKNNTGIGKTFEDYMGVVENNIDEADLLGYEIKSHREDASSYVTLFTKSPSHPHRANAYLNQKYGMPYDDAPQLHKLHTSIFANRSNKFYNKYSFRLLNDSANGVIKICVYDLDSNELLDDEVYYTYDSISKIIDKKLKNLFYVTANREYRGEDEWFEFTKAEIYTKPSLGNFLKLLDEGFIMFDIRIGSYKSGKNQGKPHDHGSGFRILQSNIKLLYEVCELVE